MSAPSHLATWLDRFPQVRVLVIGDLMLDCYIWGQVKRISPEAPVPVVQVTHESIHAGGAGNVVANIRSLGGKVEACGSVGRDQAGRRLVQELSNIGAGIAGVIASQLTTTISKTRIIAHTQHQSQQQVVRLDHEQSDALDRRVRARMRAFVEQQMHECNVVIISDYGKGAIDAELLAFLAAWRQHHSFVYLIDPKQRNFAHYRGASLVKPNKEEAGLAAGIEIRNETELRQAGDRLLDLWQAESVLVSRGAEGMSLFKRHGKAQHFPTMAREVFDVTGAGDTVLATCALALGAGATLEEATILANHAAGIVVGKVGTANVSPAELTAALQKRKP
ncbi:MAG: D-glycero-beta-D-manno-heptose-7-phosphate kinase [Deltaproteobacteria bacterium]|nr:D-glycero-beta-D-manno-heptose-7-phosphate kinase [Deltaproteobacteria bacterium]